MIVHVVMWKFEKGKEAEAEKFLEGLRGLKNVIPQIVDAEAGKNVNGGEFDAVLVSKFDSFADLEIYKNHPEHVKVSALCKKIRTERQAVDFEI